MRSDEARPTAPRFPITRLTLRSRTMSVDVADTTVQSLEYRRVIIERSIAERASLLISHRVVELDRIWVVEGRSIAWPLKSRLYTLQRIVRLKELFSARKYNILVKQTNISDPLNIDDYVSSMNRMVQPCKR